MGLSPDQKVALSDDQINHLVQRISEFDGSDDYHKGDNMGGATGFNPYYHALDRVIRLVKGEITDWTSPR